MNVSVCKVTLRLPENQSLKGKRKVISSLRSRIRNKFNVSIAEVDSQDSWQTAVLGISHVSNSARLAEEVVNNVVAYIEDSRDDIEMIGCEQETITGF